MIVVMNFDLARDHPGQRDITPTPKFWSSGTSDPSDGRIPRIVLNGDLSSNIRKRPAARMTVPRPGKKRACLGAIRLLRALHGSADAFGQLRNIGFADR